MATAIPQSPKEAGSSAEFVEQQDAGGRVPNSTARSRSPAPFRFGRPSQCRKTLEKNVSGTTGPGGGTRTTGSAPAEGVVHGDRRQGAVDALISDRGREIDEQTERLQLTIENLEQREEQAARLRGSVEEMLRHGSAELDERQAALTALALELGAREQKVREQEEELALRRQELGAVELRRAAVERREEAAAERERRSAGSRARPAEPARPGRNGERARPGGRLRPRTRGRRLADRRAGRPRPRARQ